MATPGDDQKVDLLFKEFTGVANVLQENTFAEQIKAFRPNILGDSVLTNAIPFDLADISYDLSPPPAPVRQYVYGCPALDASYGTATVSGGILIGTDLTYYHRRPLSLVTGQTPKTYYIDDGSGNSQLADTIPFKYDQSYNSYNHVLYQYDPVGGSYLTVNMWSAPYYWLLDNKSGYLELYGDSVDIVAGIGSDELRMSYIKYTGPKGVGGGGGGGDASFSFVDISGAGVLWRANLSTVPFTPSPNVASYIPLTRTYAAMNEDYYQNNPEVNINVSNRFVLFARTDTGVSQRVEGYASYCAKGTYGSGGNFTTFTERKARILITENIVKGASAIFDFIEIVDNLLYLPTGGVGTGQYQYYAFLQGHTNAGYTFEVLNVDLYENDANIPYVPDFSNQGVDPQWATPLNPAIPTIDWWNPLTHTDTFVSSVSIVGTSQAKASLTTKTLMFDTADSSYFENLDASGANIQDLSAITGSIGTLNTTTFTSVTSTTDEQFINDDLTIGSVVDPQIKTKVLKFYLNGFAPSPTTNDWVTIAQVGSDVSGASSAMRGEAQFRVQDRLSGRHQCLDIFVTQEYSRGISLDVKVSGYGSSALPYKAVRIASGSTYQGGVLQLQVDAAGLVGASNPYYLMMMDSTNNPGWQPVAANAFLDPSNTPHSYNGAYPGPLSTFTTVPVDSTVTLTTPSQNRNTGRVTTLPQYYEGVGITVSGGDIDCYSGNVTSDGGLLRVRDPSDNVLDFSMIPSSSTGLITNEASTDTPLDIRIRSTGDIDLSAGGNITGLSDGNVSMTADGNMSLLTTTGDVSLRAGGDLDISGDKVSVVAKGTAVGDDLLLGTASSSRDVLIRGGDTVSISSGTTADGNTGNLGGNIEITARDQALISGNRQNGGVNAPGVVIGTSTSAYRYCIEMKEPLQAWNTTYATATNLINVLDATDRMGQLFYAQPTGGLPLSMYGVVQSLPYSSSSSTTPRYQSLMQSASRNFQANLSVRSLAGNFYNIVNNVPSSSSGREYAYHFVTREADTVNSDGITTGDYLRMYPERELYDIWINGITIHPFVHYNHTPSALSGGATVNHQVSFEIWVGIPGPTSGTFLNPSTQWARVNGGSSTWFDDTFQWVSPNVAANTSYDVITNPNATAVKVSSFTRNLGTAISMSSQYLPFTRSSNSTPSTMTSQSAYQPVPIELDYPFRIAAGTPWTVFVVERATGTNTEVNLGASGLGYEKYGTASIPAPTNPGYAQLGVTVNFTYNMTG